MFKTKGCGIISFFSILSLILLFGCQVPSQSPRPMETSLEMGKFSDIPIPAKFKIDNEKSFIFENPAIKAGVLVYTGNGKVSDISTFYKENMPQNGWKLVSSFELKEAVLNFQKEGWSCVVNIKPGFDTTIIINVGPTASHPDIKKSTEEGFKEFK